MILIIIHWATNHEPHYMNYLYLIRLFFMVVLKIMIPRSLQLSLGDHPVYFRRFYSFN